jgi:hypothetical protein
MTTEQFFPFSPEYSSWEDWNGNLVMWYGEETIPHTSENNWKSTAKNIAELPTFASYPVSDPGVFSTWQEWAEDFTQIINGPSH